MPKLNSGNLNIIVSMAGVVIISVIISITLLAIKAHPIPPEVITLFTAISVPTITAVAHLVGFNNGTVNGENKAIADAVMTHPAVPPSPRGEP